MMNDAGGPKPPHPHLLLSVFVEGEVFTPSFMSQLHGVIIRAAPRWSSKLTVAKDEYSKRRTLVPPGTALLATVVESAPPTFGIGGAVIFGEYSGLSIILHSSRSTNDPGANGITIEVYRRRTIEGLSSSEWLGSILRELASRLPCRYGRAHEADEFDSKNLLTNGSGSKAVGVDLRKQLPGVYWLNFFGREIVERVGRQRFGGLVGAGLEEIDSGFLLQMSPEPDEWTTESYRERSEAAIRTLGPEHFFLKRKAELG